MDSATFATPVATDLREQVLALAGAVGDLEADQRDVAAVDLLGELESLKNTVAAAQARLSVLLQDTRVAQRSHQPVAMRERGIGAEVALARRESPHRGGIHLGLAVVLCAELPHTLAAMEAGWCSEWRAIQLAQGTACLSLTDRQSIDAELMSDPATTDGWGDRRFRAEVDRLAYVADPVAAVERRAKAVAQRHTSLRPAPDGMTRFSAMLPLEQGVAVHATLGRVADVARAAGDERTRGQVMADALVAAVLEGRGDGRPRAGSVAESVVARAGSWEQTVVPTAPAAPVVPVAVHVVVSDATLLNLPGEGGDEPGWVSAPGVTPVPLPADDVRDLVARADEAGLASLRRLYADPGGQLVAMESRSRAFPAGLAQFLAVRDRSCRTAYCDAPARHRDHVRTWADGGPTTAENGQGLCEACNQAKEATDWSAQVADTDPHTVETTTPTGHRHRSRAPGLPPPRDHASLIEVRLADFLLSA
ncbi:HNH endonuclease signature motif containing protein [Nocardioides sp.]|uniref:HNH endonuclease n=1 Tax=Nocardioides sp. TaxID=35761 RepID=UPI00263545AE|nr:HNH endonuclease signature motif containing protein [Nocardioides sp.]